MSQKSSTPEQYRLAIKKEVLGYKNQVVVDSVVGRLGLSPKDAEILFEDVLKFLSLVENGVRLWLSPKIKQGLEIFVLYTAEYSDFCTKYFDRFIEYDPERGLVGGNRMDEAQTLQLVWVVYPNLSKNWK